MTGAPVKQLALPGLDVPVDGDVASGEVEWVWTDDLVEEALPQEFAHTTVMLREVCDALAPAHEGEGEGPRSRRVYVDATLGGGGHTRALLERSPDARVIAFDRDDVALEAARRSLASFGDRVTLVKTTFGRVREALTELGVGRVDGLCADLGVSSPQLDEASRGMSFRREGPIDMRMDQTSGATALDLIGELSDEELADVIFRYGDERRSRRIARSVKRAYDANELVTTLDLRRAIVRAVGPARVGGVDPATRTFQALRIKVNEELRELESLLAALPEVLEVGGTAAILSFHSHEDRLVKRAFIGGPLAALTKRPAMASEEECAENPRSRSAKLRAARLLPDEDALPGRSER
ncbi:MAG TPA: 16S rRNA (cytosine(1402)-N(4))-methyltransferase RsmH [Polyangiaceae bacterium]|nr:16S rRNA (cytosine(1402)-N(4))-methyltransferase RsmH [Polyangiaceae bacterium]